MVVEPRPVEDRIDLLVTACRTVIPDLPESVQAIFLYGSSLRPGFRQDSDIDVAVLDTPKSRLGWSEQAQLADLLERALGRPVDLRMLRDGSPSYQAHVLEQGRLVWSRDARALDRYRHEALASAAHVQRRTDVEWPQVLRRLASGRIGR